MTELKFISIYRNQLSTKLGRIRKGNSLAQVIHILEGDGYKTEHHDKRTIIYWRFKILDAKKIHEQYEIYMGEFEEDKFIFGAIIPQG